MIRCYVCSICCPEVEGVILRKGANILNNLFTPYRTSVDSLGYQFWTWKWVSLIRPVSRNNSTSFTSIVWKKDRVRGKEPFWNNSVFYTVVLKTGAERNNLFSQYWTNIDSLGCILCTSRWAVQKRAVMANNIPTSTFSALLLKLKLGSPWRPVFIQFSRRLCLKRFVFPDIIFALCFCRFIIIKSTAK